MLSSSLFFIIYIVLALIAVLADGGVLTLGVVGKNPLRLFCSPGLQASRACALQVWNCQNDLSNCQHGLSTRQYGLSNCLYDLSKYQCGLSKYQCGLSNCQYGLQNCQNGS